VPPRAQPLVGKNVLSCLNSGDRRHLQEEAHNGRMATEVGVRGARQNCFHCILQGKPFDQDPLSVVKEEGGEEQGVEFLSGE